MPEAKQATKREVLTDSRQPSSSAVRFHAGALSDVQVEQPGGRTDRYGQFVFAVDGARNDPDELFDRAHAAEQIGDIAAAERLYRLLIRAIPQMRRRRSISETCFGPLPVQSKPKPPCCRSAH